jgi:hypothetical protein
MKDTDTDKEKKQSQVYQLQWRNFGGWEGQYHL